MVRPIQSSADFSVYNRSTNDKFVDEERQLEAGETPRTVDVRALEHVDGLLRPANRCHHNQRRRWGTDAHNGGKSSCGMSMGK
eukprot:COSAG02_NODE_11758_length_1661_cov_1.259923_1_plen_82_part_10